MEVGKSWPYPAEWGFPKVIPDRARLDNEAASRFMANWAAGEIRKRQRAARTTPSGRRLTGAQARVRLLKLRLRLSELEG
jgi:hypothetical protein